MMYPNPAAPSDLEARDYAGPATATAQQTRLDEAWRALRREVPTLDQQLDERTLDRDDVIDVVCAAALRVLRNPEGIESESGRIDDYQESFKRVDASADLYFTSAELARLTPRAAAFTDWSGSVAYS